jgi:methionyl aminopeptidase
MIKRNSPCWCNSGKKWKKCCYPSEGNLSTSSQTHLSPFEALRSAYKKRYDILLKTPKEIEGIRRACNLAAEILSKLCAAAKPGVTTKELDTLSRKLHKEAGATPAPLGYGEPPFPASICTSINDVICHGIPNDIPLKEGEIMNIDVSPILDGYYGDCSRMVGIGEISKESQKLIDVTYDCLIKSCEILKPGILISAIGDVISSVAHKENYSVVHQFVGHGVGLEFHEAPAIPHQKNNCNIELAPGMTFTIEPMINTGKAEGEIDPDNGWVAYTVDGGLSAQCEHTVLITDSGYEILTPWDK